MSDVHPTKQSMFVFVVLRGFLFLNTNELDNRSSKVEYSQTQFIIFLGSIDVPRESFTWQTGEYRHHLLSDDYWLHWVDEY